MAEKQVGYWFKAKKYGWGWGLPANRKGWLAFGSFVAIWLVGLWWLASYGESTEQIPVRNIVIFFAVLAVDMAVLLYLSFKYGEAPKWRWGGKTREQRKAAKSKSD